MAARKKIEPPAIRKYADLQEELNNMSRAIKIYFHPPGRKLEATIEKLKRATKEPTFDEVITLLNRVSGTLSRLINHYFDKVKLGKLNSLQNEIDRVIYEIKQKKAHMKDIPDLLHRLIGELDEERELMVKY